MDTGITDAEGKTPAEGAEDVPSRRESDEGTVTVLGFGPLKDTLPITIPWKGGTTRELLQTLAEERPELEDWATNVVVLVDGAKNDRDDQVRPGSRVELLPPISGG